MTTETGPKSLKVMTWFRETRDRIYEETKDMSRDEELRYYARRPKDPFLAELHHRARAKLRESLLRAHPEVQEVGDDLGGSTS